MGLGDAFPDAVGDQAYLRRRHNLDAASVASTIRGAIAH
jgi:hypothetical protein